MPEALKDGTVTEAAITRAAGRVLYEIVHFGYLDGQSKHDVTPQAIEENAKIIQKTGEDAAVLLKNEGGVLPLKAAELDSVVLIGPTAAPGRLHRHQRRALRGPARAPGRPARSA